MLFCLFARWRFDRHATEDQEERITNDFGVTSASRPGHAFWTVASCFPSILLNWWASWHPDSNCARRERRGPLTGLLSYDAR